MTDLLKVGDKIVVKTGNALFNFNGCTEGAIGTIKEVFAVWDGYAIVGDGFPCLFLYHSQVRPLWPPAPAAPPSERSSSA